MTFTPYSNTGPFINNITPPGINATFLNNVENFLDQIDSSLVADVNVTSNGSGTITASAITLTNAGTGLTVNHNALVSGNLTLTGTLTQAGAATFNGAGTGLTVAHNATVSGTLTAPTIGGTPTFTGAVTFNNTLNLPVGSITRIAYGFSSVTTGGTTITHNLGANPSAIFVQVAGVSATAFVTNYAAANTMTVTVSTNCNVWWLVIA